MSESPCYLTIAEAASLIQSGEFSPVELTRAHLERIAQLDPVLHAFITVTADSALAEAAMTEKEIRSGIYRGPMHGIPIAHKDIVCTQGVRTTAHSKALKDWIPSENAAVFERLRDAGAISLGKTSLHEFAFGSPGSDEAFAAARNPWNPQHAPGSSSSGSGAAVAAGLCMGATGTDTGGSIRHPASVCGVAGMKPTFGAVSLRGVIPLAPSLDHVGPMTRTVRDNAFMLGAMVERAGADYTQRIGESIKGSPIGIPRRFIASLELQPQVAKAFADAETILRDLGAELREIDVPDLNEAHEACGLIIAWEAYEYHRADLESRPEDFGAPFKERVLAAREHSEEQYRDALALMEKLRAAFAAIFASGIETIVSPGKETPADAFALLLDNPAFRGKTNRMYNMTGLPALTIPMGFSADGLPLGIQFAANQDAESEIYRVAAAYEDAAGWHRRHPLLDPQSLGAVVTSPSATKIAALPIH